MAFKLPLEGKVAFGPPVVDKILEIFNTAGWKLYLSKINSGIKESFEASVSRGPVNTLDIYERYLVLPKIKACKDVLCVGVANDNIEFLPFVTFSKDVIIRIQNPTAVVIGHDGRYRSPTVKSLLRKGEEIVMETIRFDYRNFFSPENNHLIPYGLLFRDNGFPRAIISRCKFC